MEKSQQDKDLKNRTENQQAGVGQKTGQTARPSTSKNDEEFDASSEISKTDDQSRPGGPSNEPKKWADKKDEDSASQ